jgi:hypothetical protein
LLFQWFNAGGIPQRIEYALKERESYDKFMLPKYADDIDCDKLIQCRSFQRFLKAINE